MDRKRMSWKKLIIEHRHELPFYGDDVTGFAGWLRDHPTKSERLLWREIREGALDDLEFFSQVVVWGYIVDFYCPSLQLVIEVDGGIHGSLVERDRRRGEILLSHGMRVIHIPSESILNDLDRTIEDLRTCIFKFDYFSWRPRRKKRSSSFSRLFPEKINGKSTNRKRAPEDCK